MNLTQTVSKILNREVTEEEAKTFALEQFGTLSAYLRQLDVDYKTKNKIKMKNYNYFHNGVAISKSNFLKVVPENWESEVDEFGEYSYGYYRAIERN